MNELSAIARVSLSRLQELARRIAEDPGSLTLQEELEFHRLMASRLDTKRSEERLRQWQNELC